MKLCHPITSLTGWSRRPRLFPSLLHAEPCSPPSPPLPFSQGFQEAEQHFLACQGVTCSCQSVRDLKLLLSRFSFYFHSDRLPRVVAGSSSGLLFNLTWTGDICDINHVLILRFNILSDETEGGPEALRHSYIYLFF